MLLTDIQAGGHGMKVVAAGLMSIALGGCVGLPIPGMGMPANYGRHWRHWHDAGGNRQCQRFAEIVAGGWCGLATQPGDEAMDLLPLSRPS